MYVVHITSEISPIAKAGGLGDVVYGLAKEQMRLGDQVKIILPFYPWLKEQLNAEILTTISLYEKKNRIFLAHFEHLCLILIEDNDYFGRKGIYMEEDDNNRFIYFSLAAMEYLDKSNEAIDIIHTHDWPTALCHVLYKHIYRQKHLRIGASVFTIHNLQHQGKCTIETLQKSGLDSFHSLLKDPTNPSLSNLMKGGISHADAITTVSQTYLSEIQLPDNSFGLEHVVHDYLNKFHGILNGIDTDYWNPKEDPYLQDHYDNSSLENKHKCRTRLLQELGLPPTDRPVFAAITRLVLQKGPKLLYEAILYLLDRGYTFILLGPLEPSLKEMFLSLPHHPHLYTNFTLDERLSHLTFAAADFLLIPSIFEPCGLSQMIGMRYGTIPIARRTGGLAETIVDGYNGYLFHNEEDFFPTIDRAIAEYPSTSLIKSAMNEDWSWRKSAKKYRQLYESLLSSEIG